MNKFRTKYFRGDSGLGDKSSHSGLDPKTTWFDSIQNCEISKKIKKLAQMKFSYKKKAKRERQDQIKEITRNDLKLKKQKHLRIHSQYPKKLMAQEKSMIHDPFKNKKKKSYHKDWVKKDENGKKKVKKRNILKIIEPFIMNKEIMKENVVKLLKTNTMVKTKRSPRVFSGVDRRVPKDMLISISNLLKKRKKKLINNMNITNETRHCSKIVCAGIWGKRLKSCKNKAIKGSQRPKKKLMSKNVLKAKSYSLNLNKKLTLKKVSNIKNANSSNFSTTRRCKANKKKIRMKEVNITAEFKKSSHKEFEKKKKSFPKKKTSLRFQTKFHDMVCAQQKSNSIRSKIYHTVLGKSKFTFNRNLQISQDNKHYDGVRSRHYHGNLGCQLLSLKKTIFNDKRSNYSQNKPKSMDIFTLSHNQNPILDLDIFPKPKRSIRNDSYQNCFSKRCSFGH